MKKILNISLLLIASITVYGEAVEKGKGPGVSIGVDSETKYDNAIAVGDEANTSGGYSISIGSASNTSVPHSISIGTESKSDKYGYGIAIGRKAYSNGYKGISIGESSKTANFAIALGSAEANAQSSLSIGDETKIDSESVYSTAVGAEVKVEKSIQSTLLGVQSKSLNSNHSVVLGSRANAENAGNSVVVGANSTSLSVEATTVGPSSKVAENAASSVAIGIDSYVGKFSETEIGKKPNEMSQSDYKTGIYLEERVITPLERSKYYFSTAVGPQSKSFGYQNISLGGGSESYDTNTMALGFISKAKGHFSSAIGRQAETNGKYSTALGFFSKTEGESTLSLGNHTMANIEGGVALGAYSKTNVDKNILGYDPLKNDIIDLEELLGSDKSKYDSLDSEKIKTKAEINTMRKEIIDLLNTRNGKSDEEIKTILEEVSVKEKALNDKRIIFNNLLKESNDLVSAWKSTESGVSIGDSELGITRQINNVSAGTKNTDAVNVAQLKRIKDSLENKIFGSEKYSNSGISTAVAMANLPQVSSMSGYRYNVAGSYGMYKGESAFALGLSGINKKGTIVYRASGSLNTKGNIALGIGLGYQFDKIENVDNETKGRVVSLEKEVMNYKEKDRLSQEKLSKLESELEILKLQMKELLKVK